MTDFAAEFAALRDGLHGKTAPQPAKVRQRAYKARRASARKDDIAILDMETDPFDNVSQELICPFLAVLYSEQFETIVIWENDNAVFVVKLIAAIEALPRSFTIYAHNGGKFDYMFLIHRLRGEVSFKGRGIMCATIGAHKLRDSFHILPEKLASMKKSTFDYSTLTKSKRDHYKSEVIKYCISDCVNLLYYVKRFNQNFGFKISIGAAAIAKLRESYTTETLTNHTDMALRPYFHGGRVECISGAGYYSGNLKLYDVNSMYPHVMASCRHPVGAEYVYRPGPPNAFTSFVKLECSNNGALLSKNESNELVSDVRHGVFYTSIYEYKMALELDLISDVRIIESVDNFNQTNFARFVEPLYARRAIEKERLQTLAKSSDEYEECKSEVLFLKLIMNNAYGKFAQNPRRFREHYLTDPTLRPPALSGEAEYDLVPDHMGSDYWIWSRAPDILRFNNVGTSASITGAARAMLMRAIANAKNPIYCDTDSLICEELRGETLDALKLGAWDLEKTITELIVCGKKLYAYKTDLGETIIRSKGASGLDWTAMLALLGGERRVVTNRGPTLTRSGRQYYIARTIRATAKRPIERQAQ